MRRRFAALGIGFLALVSPPGSLANGRVGSVAPRRAGAVAVPSVELETLAPALTAITAITTAGDGRLFVTLQLGQIVVWDGAQILSSPFLDVSTLITCCGERGLLSTAFHPHYAENGFFFVNYTDLTGQTIVARYKVSSDPNVADPNSGVVLLTIAQPFANHNGGQLKFGPDGFLYIGMGDGGGGNDPFCNAQSNGTLLGKMLRIDVDQNVDTPPYYGVPVDNPYIRLGGAPEAWSKGLRNPWRFSFDRATGDLFIGDVGQDAREEIDFQPAASGGGENYGWKVMEGTACGTDDRSSCDPGVPACGDSSYTAPILEYDHSAGDCTVIGGYLYRGLSIPDLYGTYVYGDYCTGRIWVASRAGEDWTPALLSILVPSLTTFGEDATGELYLGTEGGTLYRLRSTGIPVPSIAGLTPGSGLARGGTAVTIIGTNFTNQTQVFFGSTQAAVALSSPTALTAFAPPHVPGIVDVSVVNPGAPPATLEGAFVYLPLPRASPRHGTRVVVRPTP